MKTNSIGFIGGGRITRIFLQGFFNKSALPENIKVFEPNDEVIKKLKSDFPGILSVSSVEKIATQQLIFLAVHPPVMMETLQKIKESLTEPNVVISLAPKITISKIASVLPTQKLVRMIPNATSYINEGYNPVTFSSAIGAEEKDQLMELFNLLGETFETDESKLESYAIVSAMLPTYFWFQWQEMEKIALETGLTKEEAQSIIKSTFEKALKLYYESGLTQEDVMDLIPVKPIGDHESEIRNILNSKLLGLFTKIKP